MSDVMLYTRVVVLWFFDRYLVDLNFSLFYTWNNSTWSVEQLFFVFLCFFMFIYALSFSSFHFPTAKLFNIMIYISLFSHHPSFFLLSLLLLLLIVVLFLFVFLCFYVCVFYIIAAWFFALARDRFIVNVSMCFSDYLDTFVNALFLVLILSLPSILLALF